MFKKLLMLFVVFVSFASAKVIDANNVTSNGSEKFCVDVIPINGIQLFRIKFIAPLMCIDNELYSAQVSGMVIPNRYTETNHITPIAKLGKKCHCNYNGEFSNKPEGMIVDFSDQRNDSNE